MSHLSTAIGGPFVTASIVVSNDLSYKLYIKQVEVPQLSISHLTMSSRIRSVSVLLNSIVYLRTLSEREVTSQESLQQLICSLMADLSANIFDETVQAKLSFIVEQFQLAFKKKHGRRYSPDLLATAVLWENCSPRLYKQLVDEGLLTLPNAAYVQGLSKPLDVTTELSPATLAYLEARCRNLKALERNVVILIDEVFTARRIEYVNGRFFGYQGEAASKTLLCIMVKSVAGKFCDVVSLTPITNCTSKDVKRHFDAVLVALKQVELDVVAISVDNHTSNRKFYTDELCGGTITPSIPNPIDPENRIFLLIDSTHNFKNIKNNFQNKKVFTCPSFQGKSMDNVKYDHVQALFEKEQGKAVKMAHKLSDKVLFPKVLEKTNVMLADSFFHDSTIAALEYHSDSIVNSMDTATFLRLIRRYWNTVNVKTPSKGIHKRDDSSMPVTATNQEPVKFWKDFLAWLVEWEQERKRSLTRETFFALKQTTGALIELANYLLQRKGFTFVLSGAVQSDPLERRFSWYRQLSGGNFYVSVRQVLEAEKAIRMRSLVKFSKLSIGEIQQLYSDFEEQKHQTTENTVPDLLDLLGDVNVTLDFEESDISVAFYVAGYAAKSIAKKIKCENCSATIVKSFQTPQIAFDDVPEEGEEMKQEFLSCMNRGGLCTLTDLFFVSALYAYSFFNDITQNKAAHALLISSGQPRNLFCQALCESMKCEENTENMLKQKCEDGPNGHEFQLLFARLSKILFNIFAHNETKKVNDESRKEGKRSSEMEKDTPLGRKCRKLQSKS